MKNLSKYHEITIIQQESYPIFHIIKIIINRLKIRKLQDN